MSEHIRSGGADKAPRYSDLLSRSSPQSTRTAVVVVDMVNHQLTPGRAMLKELEESNVATEYWAERVANVTIPAHQRLLPAARERGAKVVYLRLGGSSRSGDDVLPALRSSAQRWEAYDGGWGCEVIDALAPTPDDVSLIKTGSGGFNSSGLDAHLRGMGIEHVAYTGVATHACVLLTLGAGFDLGYSGYLLSDATATFSAPLQTSTEEIVGAYMAEVLTVDEFVELM